MAVIVLAALGVPLWLVLGALAAGLWSRRSFRRTPGVFEAKCRRIAPATSATWPRRTVYARWVHDVLIVHQGVALVRNRALPVAGLTTTAAGDVKGLGKRPVVVRLRLDGGEEVEVAAPADDRHDLVGPFGVAEILHPDAGAPTLGTLPEH